MGSEKESHPQTFFISLRNKQIVKFTQSTELSFEIEFYTYNETSKQLELNGSNSIKHEEAKDGFEIYVLDNQNALLLFKDIMKYQPTRPIIKSGPTVIFQCKDNPISYQVLQYLPSGNWVMYDIPMHLYSKSSQIVDVIRENVIFTAQRSHEKQAPITDEQINKFIQETGLNKTAIFTLDSKLLEYDYLKQIMNSNHSFVYYKQNTKDGLEEWSGIPSYFAEDAINILTFYYPDTSDNLISAHIIRSKKDIVKLKNGQLEWRIPCPVTTQTISIEYLQNSYIPCILHHYNENSLDIMNVEDGSIIRSVDNCYFIVVDDFLNKNYNQVLVIHEKRISESIQHTVVDIHERNNQQIMNTETEDASKLLEVTQALNSNLQYIQENIRRMECLNEEKRTILSKVYQRLPNFIDDVDQEQHEQDSSLVPLVVKKNLEQRNLHQSRSKKASTPIHVTGCYHSYYHGVHILQVHIKNQSEFPIECRSLIITKKNERVTSSSKSTQIFPEKIGHMTSHIEPEEAFDKFISFNIILEWRDLSADQAFKLLQLGTYIVSQMDLHLNPIPRELPIHPCKLQLFIDNDHISIPDTLKRLFKDQLHLSMQENNNDYTVYASEMGLKVKLTYEQDCISVDVYGYTEEAVIQTSIFIASYIHEIATITISEVSEVHIAMCQKFLDSMEGQLKMIQELQKETEQQKEIQNSWSIRFLELHKESNQWMKGLYRRFS